MASRVLSKWTHRWVMNSAIPPFPLFSTLPRFLSSKNESPKGTQDTSKKQPNTLRRKNLPIFISTKSKNRNKTQSPKPPTPVSASASTHPNAPESALFGRDVAEAISYLRSNPHLSLSNPQYSAESVLRGADYLTAPLGTTEDLVYRRRAMMELGRGVNAQERKQWEQDLEAFIREEEESEYAKLEDYNVDEETLREEDMTRDIWSRENGVVENKTSNQNAKVNKEPWTVQDLGKDDGEDDSGVDRKELMQNQKVAPGPWYGI